MTAGTKASAYIGQPVRRREDIRLITGNGTYVDDICVNETQHMAILRSPHAHDDALRLDFGTALDREAERMITAGQTRDHKEALRAVAERREPKFRSRLRRTASAPIHT